MSEIERGSSMWGRLRWSVWEQRSGRWRLICACMSELPAVAFAATRRDTYYRPVCICPVGIDPDVAYPEAAR